MNKEIATVKQESPFWSLPVADIAAELQTNTETGISEEESERRLKELGPNVMERTQAPHWFLILLSQFKSPLILFLIIAGMITLFISHYRDAAFIFAAVIVNTILGFYQENKAERALSELKTYIKQRARVIRGGAEREIDAAHLVRGDIVRLSQGDRVPADARLIFINDFQVDEAVLTGESLPEVKSVEPAKPDAGLGDQGSMVFAGTLVTQGTATAVVCRTGFSTELGKIASLVAESRREETPLQKAIRRFSVQASVLLSALTVVIFGIGIIFGYSAVDMFITSVAIAVSAVPEGLPIAMTVILATGVQRMARRKGVVRKLVAAEALGSTTVILTDKTGTLTTAKMALGQVLPVEGEGEERLLELALINTNVLVENRSDPVAEWRMTGRVIEMALVQAGALRGIDVDKAKSKTPILSSLPFNAVNKFSVSLINNHGKHTLAFFGAADILVAHSSLSPAAKKETLEKIDSLAAAGELVVGVATKDAEPKDGASIPRDLKPSHLSFTGLITLRDPVRPSVKDAIRRVGMAGIKVIVMTGDHRGTAESVAREVGMKIENGSVLDAVDLAGLSDEDLKKRLPALRVISRVTPYDKMRVAKLLQEIGEVVAMTGDGVNDAPSIKQADIGIAMGSGTEVARDVADLVLLDDNFETIVAAVEEGRQIINNIRKVLVYLLSNSADALILIGGALITGVALPFNALQILWVNFFTDSFPAVAFAFERDADGLSSRPKSIKAGLFDPLMKFLIIFIGLSTSIFLFVLYWFLLRAGFQEDLVRTFIFATFGTYTLFLTFSVRSLEKSIFEYPVFSNRYLLGGVGIGVVLMLAAVYVPFLQSLFGTVPLPPVWALGVAVIGMLNIAAVEFGKWLFRRKQQAALA